MTTRAVWDPVQELALGPHGAALTGIDFCDVEEGHPPKQQAAFFTAVREFNTAHPERALAIVGHVGESFGDKSLENAVRWIQEAAEFGAHRLGYVIALGIDPAVFSEPVEERECEVLVDMSPVGSVQVLAAEKPLRVNRQCLD